MSIKTIKILEIEKGMELAEPVKNLYGQTLLAAGSTLTEEHFKIFKTWGIESVTINSEEEKPTIDLTTNLDFETMAILKKRINWNPINEHEADLYNLAVQTISNKK